jgi:protocatechuate 3,4-dioxygenase beta subunit
VKKFTVVVLVSFSLALSCIAGSLTGAEPRFEPTLQTHTGPWYEPGAPETTSLRQPGDPGKPLHLKGLVLGTRGTPIEGALVEFWHTDFDGNYPPLRAAIRTATNGRFSIRTVLPGHHLGYRARHIHFVVTHPDHQPLVTRIYFMGDPNMDEALYPELAILLEEGSIDGETRLFGNVEFVLLPY